MLKEVLKIKYCLNIVLFIVILLFSLLIISSCDSTKALNIQGDGTSVEKELQQEVASTQRDYQHKSLKQDQNTNIK